MSEKGYVINNETVAAMLTASNLTPDICNALGTAMQTLMNAIEADEKHLVPDHKQAYKALLQECRALMQEIGADVTDAGRATKTKALTYQAILEKKIR